MVNINISPAKALNGDMSIYVQFDYNESLVNAIRNFAQRDWNKDNKTWELPVTKLGAVIKLFDGYNIDITGDRDTLLNYTANHSKNVTIPKTFKYITNPYKHQEEFLEYGMTHNKFIVGDEQGLGKTKEAIDLAICKKITDKHKHCLIICCVNSNKYNWQVEVTEHSNETGYILGTRKYKKSGRTYVGSTEDKLTDLKHIKDIDSYFLITNIESLRSSATKKLVSKTGKVKNVTYFPIAEELHNLIDKGQISMIVVDEIHKVRNASSLQFKALNELHTPVQLAMSGTILVNNPCDLYAPLNWLGIENHSFYSFQQHYCIMGGFGGHQVVGYKNMGEVQDLLNDNMIRRLKKDVLDLPEKIYITDYVELTKSQEKLYGEVQEEIIANLDKIKLSNNPLQQLLRLRQVTGDPEIVSSTIKDSPKLDRLEELVEDVVASGKKCLVFSNWTQMINPALDRLAKLGYNPALYTGENIKTREEEKLRFKTDDRCKVLCGTIGAMGTGLTLTEATTVIFLDEPWNQATKAQAEDRVHRIGTKESPNIITIIAKDTIDEKIHELVYKKGKMADIIVDNEADLMKNPAVLNILLGITD